MRSNRIAFGLTAFASITIFAGPGLGLPAFPGAEGFGAATVGGRSGRVLTVTSLEDSGPGTLRQAVAAQGPRTIVFGVGGEVRLQSPLRMTEPFLTIAGQTAPGGLVLRGSGLSIETHDVIVRFIRCRPLSASPGHAQTAAALHIGGGEAHSVIVDHCSFSGSSDPCVSISAAARDVTLSWCIVSEPQSGEGIVVGGGADRCSFHHNLIAMCGSSLPRMDSGRHAFINNLLYAWGAGTGALAAGAEVDVMANCYKPGPGTPLVRSASGNVAGSGRAFVTGNLCTDAFVWAPEWDLAFQGQPAPQRSATMLAAAPVTSLDATAAYGAVLAGAGARTPELDATDRRTVRNTACAYRALTDSPSSIADAVGFSRQPGPRDSDADGLPDAWERAWGFDPADPRDSAVDADRDGYTNLEAYCEHLASESLRPRPEWAPATSEPTDDLASPATLTTADATLPLVPLGTDLQTAYVHLWAHDRLELRAAHQRAGTVRPRVWPERSRQGVRTAPGSATFIAGPFEPRLITWGDTPAAARLLVFLDPFEDDLPPDDRPVIDARAYGVTYGRSNATLRLQAALDACARRGGGVVLVPGGEHDISTVRIPSGVTLRLDRTAVLYALAEPDSPAMIVIEGVRGAGLAGPGAVDGRGSAGARRAPLVLVRNAQAVRLDGAVIRDPSGPGLVVDNCDGVELADTKIISTSSRESTGGMHINSSRRMSCERCFISANGNAVTVQADDKAGSAREVADIRISETVLLTTGTGIAVGPGNAASIRSASFQGLDILDAARGITLTQRAGAGISGLSFSDVDMRLRQVPGDPLSGVPILVNSTAAENDIPVSRVTFEDVRANCFQPSRLTGRGQPLKDIKLKGLRLKAEGERQNLGSSTTTPYLLEISNAGGVSISDVAVIWPPQRDKLWQGVLDTDEVAGLTYDAAATLERAASTQPR